MLRKKSDEALANVLAAAEKTHLADFVVELRKDISAVEAALSLPWTTSPAEGQIGRIKMIKRTMYGRAGRIRPVASTTHMLLSLSETSIPA
jgi:transposase